MHRARRTCAVLLAVGLSFGAAPLPAQSAAPQAVQLTPRRYDMDLSLDLEHGTMAGDVRLTLENTSEAPAATVSLLVNRLLVVREVRDSAGRAMAFSQNVVIFADQTSRQANQVLVRPLRTLAPGQRITLDVRYDGHLSGFTETGSAYIQDRIDTAFTIIRSDAYAFPVVGVASQGANLAARREDFDFEAQVEVPEGFVVANGARLVSRTTRGGRTTYVYRSDAPAPFVNIGIARYGVARDSGLTVFYFPADSAGAARIVTAAKSALALFSTWFGPLGGNPHVTTIEIPDGWGSQANLTAGIIQTASAFRDTTRLLELYHELSHIWNAPDLERPSPRWNEGLASFLGPCAAERLQGWAGMDSLADATGRRLVKRAETSPELAHVPMARYGAAGTTSFSYPVGMLMFYSLHRTVGDSVFGAIVGGYFRRHRSSGGTTDDFVRFAQATSPVDLGPLFDDWMYGTRWLDRLRAGETMRAIAASYH